MANLNPAETNNNCPQNSGSPGSTPDVAKKTANESANDQVMLINMGGENHLQQFSKQAGWTPKPEVDAPEVGSPEISRRVPVAKITTPETGNEVSVTRGRVSQMKSIFSGIEGNATETKNTVSEFKNALSRTGNATSVPITRVDTKPGSEVAEKRSKPENRMDPTSEGDNGSKKIVVTKTEAGSEEDTRKDRDTKSKSESGCEVVIRDEEEDGNRTEIGSRVESGSRTESGSRAESGSRTESGSVTESGSRTETGSRTDVEVRMRIPSWKNGGLECRKSESEDSKKSSGSGKSLSTNELVSLLSERPEVVEKFILEVADADNIQRLLAQRNRSSSGESEAQVGVLDDLPTRSKRTTSVTSDLFNNWLASSPIKRAKSPSGSRSSGDWRRHLGSLDEGELFMELIKDVSNELDLDVLCHKILVNVSLLTHADRGSLFLARGLPDNRYLIAKLFDVTVNTKLEEAVEKAKAEEIRIPFGVGVAGSAALCKQVVNISHAYEDPRFNPEIDQRTGYKTSLLLCVPICNYEGDVIGVAQIINKTDGSDAFTERDIEVFQRYLTFCGIGIQNAQLFEMSVQEFRRNQILLNLARNIFTEQNNLECLVTKIMTEARELLKCERCAVFLLDSECGEAGHLERILERPGKAIEAHKPLMRRESNNVDIADVLSFKFDFKSIHFTKLFEMRDGSHMSEESNPQHQPHRKLNQIAKYVAATGQILNIGDVQSWFGVTDGNPDSQEESEEEQEIKCILCMPILNGQKTVIGVAQLINKETGQPFTDCDVSIFEAFAIFCGLGIHNTQMYESACKLMAKQKVALECLSYHATASLDDTLRLINDEIPSVETYNLYSFKFIDFDLTDDDTCRATIRMFLQCNLVQQFHIPYEVLCRWVLSVKKNYRPVKYHNWRHALNVAQTMFAMLKTGKMERFMTDLEILGLLVACLCHDLDHRGTNNAFQTKTESPLAILYTTSTMEHHHFDQCVMILNSDGNNIFQALSTEDYRTVMKIVENSILSTDLAMYFKKKSLFMELVENGEFDWQSESKKEILCGILMTACDVGAIAKPWEVQHKMAKLVADEFFDQGDLEKLQLNQQPMAMMDRERKDELPKMQVGFIDLICLPLYKVLSETFPWIQPLYEGTMENRRHWQDLAEKVEMGLTWIDHDVIEKPIEEFSSDLDAKDIEFTVTTLNCVHSLEKRTPERIADGDSMSLVSASTVLGHGRNGGGTRFASLRKSKAFGKTVRERFSRSLYQQAQAQSSGSGLGQAASPSKEHMSESVSNQDSLFSQTSSSTRSTDKLAAAASAIPEDEEKPHETKPPPKAKSKICRII